MSKNEQHIENIFRSGFEGFSPEPSPGVWGKVYSKLLWKQFFSFRLNSFNVYYLTAALTIAGAGIYLLRPVQNDQPASGNFHENAQILSSTTPESGSQEVEILPEVRVQKDLSKQKDAQIVGNPEQSHKKSSAGEQTTKIEDQISSIESNIQEPESSASSGIPGTVPPWPGSNLCRS